MTSCSSPEVVSTELEGRTDELFDELIPSSTHHTTQQTSLWSEFSKPVKGLLFDYRIRIGIHNEYEPTVNPTYIRHAYKSFDLPSECEPRFTVNPDPDPIIEQPLTDTLFNTATD